MNTMIPDPLKLETFSSLLKTRFRVYPDTANFIELELVEATEIHSRGKTSPAGKVPVQESFSLMFNGPENRLLPQRIYLFEHDRMGRFDLFIVPVGQKSGFIQYQAIINRLVKPG
jgi:hypothetical protein